MEDRSDKVEFERVSHAITRACTPEELRSVRLDCGEYIHRKRSGYSSVQTMGELLSHREDYNLKRRREAARTEDRELPKPSATMQRLNEIRKTVFHCTNDVPSIIASYQRCIRLMKELSFSDPDERNEANHSIALLENRINVLKQEMSNGIFS